MRFATYNIWNAPTHQQARQAALINALMQLNADVIALQEVPTAFGHDEKDAGKVLAEQSHYPYSYFRAYPTDPDEGLAFLSRYPLQATGADWDLPHSSTPACAIGAALTIDHVHLTMTNVHLDWSSSVIREEQIRRVVVWHNVRKAVDSFSLLVGDFNATPESSIYRFLSGQQSLDGIATPPWVDLAAYDAFIKQKPTAATLDFITNPRWRNTPTLELPMRVDWLLFGADVTQKPPQVQTVALFGVEPLPPTDIVPSDHYGVYADLVFA